MSYEQSDELFVRACGTFIASVTTWGTSRGPALYLDPVVIDDEVSIGQTSDGTEMTMSKRRFDLLAETATYQAAVRFEHPSPAT